MIHDWGSALGFHYAMRHEDNVKRIAFMEAVFMPGRYKDMPPEIAEFFQTVRGPNSRELLIGQKLILNLSLIAAFLVGSAEERTEDVWTNRLRGCYLDYQANIHAVALACPGVDYVRPWPLPVTQRW